MDNAGFGSGLTQSTAAAALSAYFNVLTWLWLASAEQHVDTTFSRSSVSQQSFAQFVIDDAHYDTVSMRLSCDAGNWQ